MRRSFVFTALLAAAVLSAGCTPVGLTTAPPVLVAVATQTAEAPAAAASAETTVTFAVIGDYGSGDSHEKAVAGLVASWAPDFVLTTGDNFYRPTSGSGTGKYDRAIGAYYCAWLKDISTTGTRCRIGKASLNAFFPALGNHDYSDGGISNYLKYFRLPGSGFANSSGNERYYDFVEGPVHFFVLNSNTMEPSGTKSTSKQAKWLKAALAASTSPFNVVYDHHPPYSSDKEHGSSTYMRWPFASWGADAVLSGHAHVYERLSRNGIAYFVNGLGGDTRYGFGKTLTGSKVRYRGNWGAQRATATSTTLTIEFVDVTGRVRDRWTVAAH